MKLFITLFCALSILSLNSFAGTGNPSNVAFPSNFTSNLKESRHLFEATSAKICSCQILQVASKNEADMYIAVFAQAVNNGDASAKFANAATVLEKEKKHLRSFFYTKIKTTENVTAATECSMLYKNIQVKYANVKMYDVLDADALSNKQLARQ